MIKEKSDMFYQLKKINPLKLDEYLQDYFILKYEEGIELTHYYIKKLINRIQVDENLKNRWLILNNKYRDAFLSNIRIHLFRTFTGSGKTVTSVLWVKFLTQLSSKIEGFVVLSPEYEHGTEEIRKIIVKHGNQVDYVYFEGKYRLCTELDVQINDNGLTIGMLMKSGISTTKYCENECGEYKSCIYMGNCKTIITPIEKGGIKSWIGVQHQIGYFMPIYMYHVGDIILIIDENFSDAIKVNKKYGKPLLQKNLNFLNKVLKELKPDADENYRYFVEEFKKLLENFIKSLFTHLTELDYDAIGSILDNIDDCEDTYIDRLNEQAFDFIKNGELTPFKFIFGEICNFIDNYEDLLASNYENIEAWMRASFYKKQNKYEISFLYYDKHKLDNLFNRDNLLKLIINDATVDKIELKYLIGDKEPIVEHNENWMYEDCEFHQLKKKINNKPDRQYAYYPKKSFEYKKTFYYLIDDLKVILEKHENEKVLVVARNIGKNKKELKKMVLVNGGISLSNYIKTLGNGNVFFEDYPLKGTNKYSKINVIVILGKPELPTSVIKRQATLLGMNSAVYREIYSRTSMIQAIGRILRGNNHKYVYILSGFDLKLNRPIKTYKSHTDLRKTFSNEIKTKKKEKGEINKILGYLKKNKFITIKKYAEIYNTSPWYAGKKLNELVKKGIIKFRKVERGKKLFYI